MKSLVGAVDREIVKTDCETDGSFYCTSCYSPAVVEHQPRHPGTASAGERHGAVVQAVSSAKISLLLHLGTHPIQCRHTACQMGVPWPLDSNRTGNIFILLLCFCL